MILIQRLRDAAVRHRDDGVYALLVEAAEVLAKQAEFIAEQDERAAWSDPTRWAVTDPAARIGPAAKACFCDVHGDKGLTKRELRTRCQLACPCAAEDGGAS